MSARQYRMATARSIVAAGVGTFPRRSRSATTTKRVVSARSDACRTRSSLRQGLSMTIAEELLALRVILRSGFQYASTGPTRASVTAEGTTGGQAPPCPRQRQRFIVFLAKKIDIPQPSSLDSIPSRA